VSAFTKASETTPGPTVLVVDDRLEVRDLLTLELEELGCAVIQAADGEAAWDRFLEYQFALVITDLRMPRCSGMELLRRIRAADSPNPCVPVLLLSAYGSLPEANAAGRAGATDFLPFNEQGIEQLIGRAGELLAAPSRDLPIPLLGTSAASHELRRRVSALATLSASVLLVGPRGGGREEIAREIHAQSRLSSAPFLAVPATEFESGFGRLPAGTLFVRDAQAAPIERQAALAHRLRTLERGSSRARLRVVASITTSDVKSPFQALHPDLEQHLSRFRIVVPGLDQRGDDLSEIAAAFISKISSRLELESRPVTVDALDLLRHHRWSDHLIEMERVLESALPLAGTSGIDAELLGSLLTPHHDPLTRIEQERRMEERERLLELYRKHGTYSGVARELGVTRNAVKYRLKLHRLLPDA